MAASTISRTVLREQVKDVLLARIVSGELKPGERLVETRIAAELGTSQAPVREALRDLELLRLVESEPFRGARVREFGDGQFGPATRLGQPDRLECRPRRHCVQ